MIKNNMEIDSKDFIACTLLVCITLLIIMFVGEPDIQDAITKRLTGDKCTTKTTTHQKD